MDQNICSFVPKQKKVKQNILKYSYFFTGFYQICINEERLSKYTYTYV